MRIVSFMPLVALLALSATLGGCSKEITINQYPDFYTPELKTIAVLPFQCSTGDPNAGNIISDKVARALMANGSYKVYNRADLKALMDEHDLQLAFGSDSATAAQTLQKLGNVQAILTGNITTYGATTNSQQKQDPVYSYNPQTKATYVSGYRTYTLTRHEANVAATAALIKVSSGTAIHATPAPAQWQAWAQGSPPQYDANACLASATDNVVSQLVEEFAIVRKTIKVDPGDTFRTATDYYDGKWNYSDKFSVSDEKMYVMVKLPVCCDKNYFRVTIVREGMREDLVDRRIEWTKGCNPAGEGLLFNPAEIASKGGGPGKYEAKFYAGPEPVIIHKFEIIQ